MDYPRTTPPILSRIVTEAVAGDHAARREYERARCRAHAVRDRARAGEAGPNAGRVLSSMLRYVAAVQRDRRDALAVARWRYQLALDLD